MYETQPLTALEPKLKLICDHPPPKGKRMYLVSLHGAGFLGEYHPEQGAIAWCELPKLQPNDKLRLRELGYDI